jgi:predicted nucleic acid-binding protein
LSGFLLDTNIISLLSPGRADVPRSFASWAKAQDEQGELYLSVVTVHEIEKGIALLSSKGATKKARDLRRWLSGLTTVYNDRILPITAAIGELSGRAEAKAVAAGHHPGMADALIAGTAQFHDLVLVTSNLRHFRHFDVALTSPADVAAQAGD